MTNKICAMGASLVVAGGALMLSGCGSSSSPSSNQDGAAAPHTTTLPSGQTLVEAADHTDQASGYRINATMKVTVGSTSLPATIAGVIEDHGKVASLTDHESIAGHTLNLQMRLGHGLYFMSGVPGQSQIAHGKQWLSFSLAQTQEAEGLGGLQSSASSNPAEFLKYLRTVGSDVTPVGTTTIDGDQTTEYQATLNFDRYTRLVPAAQRATARQSVSILEKAIGSHTLPVTAWVDGHHDVRRVDLSIPECIEGHRLSLTMSMNLSDYGDVPAVTVPSPSQAYDITPTIKSELPDLKSETGGCSSSTAG